jgi:hypothetical protein
MTVQTFRDLLAQRPFRPFRIIMSSGLTYEIKHPEGALVTLSTMVVGTGVGDDNIPASVKICELSEIDAVEAFETESESDVPTSHLEELDRRIADALLHPEDVIPWEEVKSETLKRWQRK